MVQPNNSKSGQQQKLDPSAGKVNGADLAETLIEQKNNANDLQKTMLESREAANNQQKTAHDPYKTLLEHPADPANAKTTWIDQQSTSVDAERPSIDFSPDKFIGVVIAERYEILSLAGRGGMSAVYKARHLLTGKIVALKLMLPHLLTDENAVRRFHQEAKAASRLNHPHAISVQDMGVNDDGQPFLTMDYLDGRSLTEEIRINKKLKPNRSLHIFVEVCNALAHAHEQQIVHRDLKPSNVMLINQDDDNDFVKVVDFGIAKIMRDGPESMKLTKSGDVFGSPYYMSPEQCLGNKLDPRSDIYSMGCLMYETLTGNVPHEGKNVLETMFKHTNLAAPTLSDINDDPRTIYALDQILQKCLAKLPEQRYQSMTALRKDLENVAQANKKGSKIAAQIGINAVDKGRQFDNRLAAFSSKKLFWISVPLLTVLAFVVFGFGFYWITTSGDPGPSDRLLSLNRDLFRAEHMEKLTESVERRVDSETVLKESLDKLGEESDSHQFYLDMFKQLLREQKNYEPEQYYLKVMRFGFYFTKTKDYDQAIRAFHVAMETAATNNFTSTIDDAKMHAAIATCLLATGSGLETDARLSDTNARETAYDHARIAYKEFAEVNTNSDASVTSVLGTLLELSAKQPDRFRDGVHYLANLLGNRRQVVPAVEGLAYAQAAEFVHAYAASGATTMPLRRFDAKYQQIHEQVVATSDVEQECLQKSLTAWEELKSKSPRVSDYNQGVIYNRMGLLAQQQKDLPKADEYFTLAIDHLAEANNAKDEAAAKVLFNLSDVQLAQHRFWDYYTTHTDAKRVWDGTFHLGKRATGV